MSAATIASLIGAIATLVKLWLAARGGSAAERYALAREKLKLLEAMSDDEIAKARAAHDRARRDPRIGEL